MSKLPPSSPAWRTFVASLLRKVLRGACVTGEDIRHELEKCGVMVGHQNAWGSLVNWMKSQGYLVETGEMRQPTDKRSKGKARRVYRVL